LGYLGYLAIAKTIWECFPQENFLKRKEGLPRKVVELALLLLEEVLVGGLPSPHLEVVVGVDFGQHQSLVG